MNDTELDEMLNQWDVQDANPLMREKARVKFRAVRARRTNRSGWRRIAIFLQGSGKGIAAGLVAATVFLLIVIQASPKMLALSRHPFRIPWLVEYEAVRYGNDGLPNNKVAIMSFSRNGKEVILSESDSSIMNAVRVGLLRVAPALLIPSESSEDVAHLKALIRNGCATGRVIGHETILKHLTTVVQNTSSGDARTTEWLAPDLECFALRLTSEERKSDGAFRLVLRKQATQIIPTKH
jgi:hypothetical protein